MSDAPATMTTTYETVIGLECHVELSTRTKMFCGCRNEFGAPPNTNVCPVCLGHPGTLPVPNEKAIESIVKIGLALDCAIAPHSLFHRKNYFYPDMPKNFQISQYDLPICVSGHLNVEVDGEVRRIGITRVHMEEDTGKTTHAGTTGRIAEAEYALEDYNRAGVPLVEVVSEPDMRSPEEARAYLNELRAVLESLGVSDVRMEEGSLRCDANISLRPVGGDGFGTKVEVKNVNSVRSLYRALKFEQERQRAALEAGEPIAQETRHFDENAGTTSSMRSKEFAFDYRYFPEPDLSPLEPDAEWIEALRASLPELPAARRGRLAGYLANQGLDPAQARLAARWSPSWENYFRTVVDAGVAAPMVFNWLTQEYAEQLRLGDEGFAQLNMKAADWKELSDLLKEGRVSATVVKDVLAAVWRADESAADVVERLGLWQVSDAGALESVIDEVIAENPGPAEQFRNGKEGALNALVGPVMRKTGGSANPKMVQELLRNRLSVD